ncbi:hypothetical protein C0J52_14406 [Blattella germanica]|nr:hypothetical protein C0J52_14406 [Blattella germanica]
MTTTASVTLAIKQPAVDTGFLGNLMAPLETAAWAPVTNQPTNNKLFDNQVFSLGSLSGPKAAEIYADYSRNKQHRAKHAVIQPAKQHRFLGECDIMFHILFGCSLTSRFPAEKQVPPIETFLKPLVLVVLKKGWGGGGERKTSASQQQSLQTADKQLWESVHNDSASLLFSPFKKELNTPADARSVLARTW